MPVKDKSKYPADWKQISQREKDRADHRCELCLAANYIPHPITGSKVVLTVHHIAWLEGEDNNQYPNLIVVCQRCHNRLDHGMRMRNAKATRERKEGK